MNSAYNVGIPQQRRIQEELTRAAFFTQNQSNWRSLYNRSDFFERHANFLQITIRVGNNSDHDEFTKWLRLCESRLRILVAALNCPEMSVWPFAQIIKTECTQRESTRPSVSISRRNEINSSPGNNVGACDGDESNASRLPEALFFVGLRFARNVESIDLKQHTSEFLINQINTWEGRKAGMDFMIHHVLQKDLPHDVIRQYLSSSCTNEQNNGKTSVLPCMRPLTTTATTKISPRSRTTVVPTKNVRDSDDDNIGLHNMISCSSQQTNEPLHQEQRIQHTMDGIEISSRPHSPQHNLVMLEGVPLPEAIKEKGKVVESDGTNKINQEQLYKFLTGKTDDLPQCLGSADECTLSTNESEDKSSTRSPLQKRPRNRSRSGTEDSEL